MKSGIHPEMKDITATCACGASFTTKSTKGDIQIEVCNECHPFYTGAQGKNKKTGAVEKFNRKFGLEQNDNEKAA